MMCLDQFHWLDEWKSRGVRKNFQENKLFELIIESKQKLSR